MPAQDITSVGVLPNYHLRLQFADGEEGTIDVQKHVPFVGAFAPLSEPSFFEQVAIYPELKTIFWPGNVDICHDLLYQWAINDASATAIP
jgi:hypothetical protein